jgi:hypothetical protein
MRMQNPFTLTFGKEPPQLISRIAQTDEIIEDFTANTPANQVYMITGVRGYGKTVLLTSISKQIGALDDWKVVALNPTRDLLQSFASKLYSIEEFNRLFIQAKFNFSAFGLGASVEKSVPVTDIETAIEMMLKEIKKSGKRILITIDEVTKNDYVRTFVSAFQIFVREEYPIYLLMTGLYQNIYDLQNDKSLTFLYRAPKIDLKSLNLNAIARKYESLFAIPGDEAMRMARYTNGYPFAFQVLGYLRWKNKSELDELLPEYDQYLDEYSYDKIWSELSEGDKELLYAIAVKGGKVKTRELVEATELKSNYISVYRDRLKKRGILDTSNYGYMSFLLPRFDVFVNSKEEMLK